MQSEFRAFHRGTGVTPTLHVMYSSGKVHAPFDIRQSGRQTSTTYRGAPVLLGVTPTSSGGVLHPIQQIHCCSWPTGGTAPGVTG
jgi:hypothetical protein